MDHLTKRAIILLLLKFVKKVEKSLKDEDRVIILKRITEGSPKDEEFLKTCQDAINCKILSEAPRDLIKEFNGNILEILDHANDFEERDLAKLAELVDKKNYEINEEKTAELVDKFQGCSFKKKFVTLLILKSGAKYPSSDMWKDFINSNFSRNEFEPCSRALKLLYEKVLFELLLQVIQQFWNLPDAAQPLDSDVILEIIGRRLECGEDFCNTMFLFKFLYFFNISQKQKAFAKRLLDLSYKEMMAYRGKSHFSLYCSSFIECFPTKDIPISITIEKLLQDISLNSPEITKAIAEKLPFLNLELLANLLSSREGVDASFFTKNSPLRDLQFEIVDFVVNSKKYKAVLEELLKKYDAMSKTKAMYYPNSHHHLTKLRIVQGIAAIVHHTNIWRPEYLEFLLNEANQPSILYILELIVAQTIPDETISHLTEMLKSAKHLKMHSAQSIFCILYLLCRKKNSPDFCRTCFNAIYPWTMGQNFSCRLYAQIAILKIHKLLSDTQSQPQEKYITKSLLFSFYELSGNPEKNMERLKSDFRFNFLNENYLLSPTYIFRDIPRITGVAETEIVSYCNGEEDLKTIVHPWQQKQAPGVTSVQETYENIQTKIVPPEEFGHEDERKSSGLIVCASLVDNHPNLGGLARTCEIFGVQKFILNSLRDVENSQFLALSMSAEKWLMLEEVKKWQLIDFCAEMKRQGYTIVGAEQTHEKEGLPADVIANLDIVVEIPQIGRLRSLNVHVTGSIFIYEYAKQHLI
uniref:tRNA/rRNA methyltransferase SpoU type domain-containing protein n=1 Tax=Phlebotomus papatasi TaxID=29031 RepID=A0A1B0GM97_PHLPP